MRRSTFVAAGAASLAGLGFAKPASAADEPVRFAFLSAFWMNLHHRLHADAGVTALVRGGGHPTRPASLALLADRARLSASQAAIWDGAVQRYIDGGYAKRSLLFDGTMVGVKEALRKLPAQATPASTDIPSDLRAALTAAAPVYSVSLWPQDDAANRAWIVDGERLVASYGAEMTRRLRTIYAFEWPFGPYGVDVVRFGAAFTAYTTVGPVHAVIDSSATSGFAALETLYHEASHGVVFEDAGTIGTAIENAATVLGRTEPHDLWHAVIFFTAGSVVAEIVRREKHQTYTPYADAHDLWANWPGYREALARSWSAYVDGASTMQAALTAVVDAIPRVS